MNVDIKEVEEKLRTVPYFSKDNVSADMYDGLSKLRTLLCERGEDDPHLLNKGNVLAVWYLTELTYDGQPQLIVHTTIPSAKWYDKTMLDGEIFNVVHHDIAFDYDEDIIKGNTVIEGEQEELFREILEDRVVLVYDTMSYGAAPKNGTDAVWQSAAHSDKERDEK